MIKSVYIFLFVIFCVLPGSVFGQSENSAIVKFIIGTAERLPANKTSWGKLSLNTKVFKGDRIKTSLNSRVEIEMPDGSKVRVDQNSIFDVNEIKTNENDGEDEMSFSLWVGNIWASFKKVVSSRQTRRIESPSAVVAIRGTILEVNVDRQQTTRVTVEEGLVAVTSKDVAGEVEVGANQETTIKKGAAPTAPIIRSSIPGTDDRSGMVLRLNNIPVLQKDVSVLGAGIQVSGKTVPGARVMVDGQPLNVTPNGIFSGRVKVVEGLNNFKLIAEKNGVSKTEAIRVFVNTRRPNIRLSSPLVAGYLNKRDYSLSGAVFDETPLDKVKVMINGDEIAEVQGRGSFNRTIILQEGKNDIRISALDLAQNSMEISERIFLDTVKPIITITEPAQQNFNRLEPPGNPDIFKGLTKERFVQVVRGIIIDPEPSSKLKRVTINGKEVKPNSDGSFHTEVFLARGENRLQIYAEDLAGNIVQENTRRIFVR